MRSSVLAAALVAAGCALPQDRSWLPMAVSPSQLAQCRLEDGMGSALERNIFIQGFTSDQSTSRCVNAATQENVEHLGRLIGMRLDSGGTIDDRAHATLLGVAEGCGIPAPVSNGLRNAMNGAQDAAHMERGRSLAPQATAGACAVARRITVEAAAQRGLYP